MSEMLKCGLQMVEEDEASGELKPIYDSVKRDFQMPHVPNLMKTIAMSPAALTIHVESFKSFFTHSTLPQSLISIIQFTIAQKSNCVYCASANEVMCRTLGVDEDTLIAITQNLGELNPERVRTIIEFALKTAQYPQELEPKDYELLRAQGISNDEIVQIIQAVGMAVYVDIMADALKAEVDPDVARALGQ